MNEKFNKLNITDTNSVADLYANVKYNISAVFEKNEGMTPHKSEVLLSDTEITMTE